MTLADQEQTAGGAAAAELVAAARAGDPERTLELLQQVLGLPRSVCEPAGRRPAVKIYRWICPVCLGCGRDIDGGRCALCVGYGLTNDIRDPAAWGDRLKPAPTPPAVMRAPCGDCAFRPGSPEETDLVTNYGNAPYQRPDESAPFFCHHGMHRLPGDAYESPAYVGSLPLGAMVCAGWWAMALDMELPDHYLRPYRQLPGADRPEQAPEEPA